MAKLTIDGVEVETQERDLPLLWFLRDHLQKTGTRYGCGRGLCGACTVLVDGQAVRSCQLPVAALGLLQQRRWRRCGHWRSRRHATQSTREGELALAAG